MALVVEVADASLRSRPFDQEQVYAHAGIPVYWIVNLQERRVEVYTDPSGPLNVPTIASTRTTPPARKCRYFAEGRATAHIPVAVLLPTDT